MRLRRSLAVLAAAALVLPACGGGDEPDPSLTPSAEDEQADAAAVADGVAAVVNGTEIPHDVLAARIETAASTPQVSQMLEGDQGDQIRAQLEASILSQLVLNRIVLDGAEEFGVDVDEDAVEETRSQLVSEAGGEDAFAEEVAAAGLDPEQLLAELEAVTAMRLVREELVAAEEAESAEEPEAGPTPTPQGSPGDAALQQWLVEHLQSAQVQVDPEIGRWDPAQGMIVPPAAEAPAPGTPPVAPSEAG